MKPHNPRPGHEAMSIEMSLEIIERLSLIPTEKEVQVGAFLYHVHEWHDALQRLYFRRVVNHVPRYATTEAMRIYKKNWYSRHVRS